MDGPLSFVLLFGLLGVAVTGAGGFLVCLAATCHPRYRRRVLRSWKFGTLGGLLALFAMSLFQFSVALDVVETQWSLFLFWSGLAFFAGFAAGTTLDVSLR